MKQRLVTLLFFAIPALAQESILRPIRLPEAAGLGARVDRSLLPSHTSHLEVEPKQVFRLVAPGQPDLMLVPVTFWHGEPSQISANQLTDRSRCGLFVIPADATPQTFVYTLTGNEDLAVSQCGTLMAIRRTPHDGPHPHLRLTYRTFDPPASKTPPTSSWSGTLKPPPTRSHQLPRTSSPCWSLSS